MIMQNPGLVMVMLCLIPSVSAVHPSNVLLGGALSLSVGGPTIHYPIHPLFRRVCYIPNQLLWSGSGL